MVSLNRPYHFKFSKGCVPQILLDPFLNTLSHQYYSLSLLPAIEYSVVIFVKRIVAHLLVITFC